MNRFTSGGFKRPGKTLAAAFLLSFFLIAGCRKVEKEPVRFELDGDPGLAVPIEGISKTYQIKSNGLWMIEVIDGGDWIEVSPVEGTGDGSFTVTIDKNRISSKRAATLGFRVNHIRQKQLLKVEQQANPDPPYFKIEGDENKLEISGAGGVQEYHVLSNSAWSVVVPDGTDWVHLDPASGEADGTFKIKVDKNPAYTARTAQLSFVVDDQTHSTVFTITQEGKVDETVLLNEDFSWLNYGSAIFYTTTGETRIDSWSEEQLAKGWTSTVNPISGSGSTPLVYARQGFVKLGKTNYGGDLISPALTGIEGTKNLVVTFKAVPYQTQGGTRDGNILKVGVVGPGTVSVETFTINNWPDYSADPECTEIWKAPETTRSFTVTGATSETQIRFLGQDFDLRAPVDPNKNRIFLDDIIVTIKP